MNRFRTDKVSILLIAIYFISLIIYFIKNVWFDMNVTTLGLFCVKIIQYWGCIVINGLLMRYLCSSFLNKSEQKEIVQHRKHQRYKTILFKSVIGLLIIIAVILLIFVVIVSIFIILKEIKNIYSYLVV